MKIPNKKSKNEIKAFFEKKGLEDFLYNKSKFVKTAYKPVYDDLYFLYNLITLNKRINILEFGTGYSSLILSVALRQNREKYFNRNFNNLGFVNPFSLTIIDDQKEFIKISKKRINHFGKKKLCYPNYHYSECKLVYYNERFCNSYTKLPNFIPDFIYLDGPDINKIRNNVSGIRYSSGINYPPLSCDILKLEYFLNPGTIIVIDGRSNNSLFLKNNLQREWIYKYQKNVDQHYFYLNEKPNGIKSKKLLTFYNS